MIESVLAPIAFVVVVLAVVVYAGIRRFRRAASDEAVDEHGTSRRDGDGRHRRTGTGG